MLKPILILGPQGSGKTTWLMGLVLKFKYLDTFDEIDHVEGIEDIMAFFSDKPIVIASQLRLEQIPLTLLNQFQTIYNLYV